MDWFNKDFMRAPAEMIEAFASAEAATVYEANGQRWGMDHTIRPIAWGQHVVGSAYTVRCHPADNLMLHVALAEAAQGDIIVADVGPLVDAGYWGEVATVAAMARGIAGLVISGGVRDRAPIVKRGFPIWSGGICMRGTVKETLGTIGHPVVVGGVMVHAGDLVIADDDGVAVVPQAELASALANTQAREAKEADQMARLQQGEMTLDLLGLRKKMADRGIQL